MQQAIEKEKYYIKDEDNKVLEFLKKNILNFLIAIVVIVFLVKDLIQIKESGRTVVEIIANSIVNLIVGQLIKNLFLQKGSNAGFNAPSYQRKLKRYSDEIEKTDPIIDKLDDFCEKKNEQRIQKAQKHVLRPARIKYEDFLTKTKEEVCKDKTQLRTWDKAQAVKVQIITPENLVSETDPRYEKGKKEETLKAHKAKEATKSFIIATLISVIFGYFVPMLNENALAGMLWNLIQVAIWLAFGIVAYYQEYTYITVDYAQRVLRKTTYLVEFNTTTPRENKETTEVKGENENGNKEQIEHI